MKTDLYLELDLNNVDSLEGKRVIAAKPQKATGQKLVKIINNPGNAGLMWMVKIKPDLDTIKVCCEEIIARNEKGTLQLKLAKQILKLIKAPRTRNVVERRKTRKPKKR